MPKFQVEYEWGMELEKVALGVQNRQYLLNAEKYAESYH